MSSEQRRRPVGSTIVVGAGIVGLSTALALTQRGAQVTVLDKTGPGAGASWGNAGWVAPALTVPLPEPALLKQAPRALLSPRSPVKIPASADRELARFMSAMARHCSHQRWSASMAVFARLNAEIFGSFDRQLAAGVRAEVTEKSMIAGFESAVQAAPLIEELAGVAHAGQPLELDFLDGASAREIEPQLGPAVGFALRIHRQRYLNPGAYVAALADAVGAAGGTILGGLSVDSVTSVPGSPGRIRVRGKNFDENADAVVLANGAWMPRLARAHGVRIAQYAGRGYSCSVPIETELVGATYFPAARAAITPRPAGADGRPRIRVAGVMEFADPDRPLNPERIATTNAVVKRMLTGIDWSGIDEQWVGSRPLSADGRPLIGATATPGVFVGGGHGMWGLTLGPLTGELLAEQIVTGRSHPLLAGVDPLR